MADYMVGNAPQPASYAGNPQMGFQTGDRLADLYKRYYEGTQMARTREMQDAFKGGVPTDANGNPDTNQILRRSIQLGGVEAASPLLQMMLYTQGGSDLAKHIMAQPDPVWGTMPSGGGGPPGPGAAAPPPGAPGAAAAPPGAQPAPQQQSFKPSPSPAGAVAADNNAQPTVRSIATETFPNRDVSEMLPRFASAVRAQDPDTPLSPQQVTALKPLMTKTAQSSGGFATPATMTSEMNQPAQVSTAAERNQQPSSQGGGGGSGSPAPLGDRQPNTQVLTQRSVPPTGIPRTPPQPQPSAPPAAVAKPNPLEGVIPPGANPRDVINRYNMAIQHMNALAASVGRSNPKAADAAIEQGKQYAAQRDKILDAMVKANELTPEQKNAYSSGMPSPLAMDAAKTAITTEGKNQELTPEQKLMRQQQESNTLPGATPGAPMSPLGFEAKKEEQKNEISQSQKTYNGIQASSTQYQRDMKPYLDLSKSILNRPEFYSGAGGQISLNINKVKALLGDQTAALLQEGLQKVTAVSVLGQINLQRDQLMEAGGTSSRIFSAQVDLVEKAAPALSTTVNGNRFLVNVADRMGNLQTKIAGMARDYIAANGHLDPGFDALVGQYMTKNPVFTQQELSDPRILGAPDAPASINTPAEAQKWTRSMGLKQHDPFRLPNGTVKYVP